jgi:hypothetical protein
MTPQEEMLNDILFESLTREELERLMKHTYADHQRLEAEVEALKAALAAMPACAEDDHVCPQVVFENYEMLREHQRDKIRLLEAENVELTRQRDYLAAWMDDMAKAIPEVQQTLNELAFFEEYGHLFFEEDQDE